MLYDSKPARWIPSPNTCAERVTQQTRMTVEISRAGGAWEEWGTIRENFLAGSTVFAVTD
jgi:hypothetical protein